MKVADYRVLRKAVIPAAGLGTRLLSPAGPGQSGDVGSKFYRFKTS
jgi:hypothetical protein